MAGHQFEHLPLLLRYQGPAKLYGGGSTSPQTLANKNARATHSSNLKTAASTLSAFWKAQDQDRPAKKLPPLPAGKPILVQVDPSLDLDVLREKFRFEVVSEQDEGFVLVATEDVDLTEFKRLVDAFAVSVHGSAKVADVYKLYDDPQQVDRLRRVLSERLAEQWPTIAEQADYVVDVSISCTGTIAIPDRPVRGKRDTDASWAQKEKTWSNERASAYDEWSDLLDSRQDEVVAFVSAYEAEVLNLSHDGSSLEAGVLPDGFTVRLRIAGRGLKDLVLNYPYVFEVTEPDDIALPQNAAEAGAAPLKAARPTAPPPDAPAVCVVDSGIQEKHVLLAPAIDSTSSRCFLPGTRPTDVVDLVRPGGHGTRVAGAVLYGELVPDDGTPALGYWIQNARVLDGNNRMPEELFPPTAIRAAVEHFHEGSRRTRIFNHSINSNGPARTGYMSAWAAEIDSLCNDFDILIVQSVGNVFLSAPAPRIGIAEHLAADRDYPDYLNERSCRVANPGQSMHALTVGSVAYGALEGGLWRSFASELGQASAFTRTGPAIWSVLKPEVVEFGGDAARAEGSASVNMGGVVPGACPALVRSTMYPPGPAHDRDESGTSFATPKVARIAAAVQRALPSEPALLYRALVVQSAQWPEWAEALLMELRSAESRKRNAQSKVRRGELLDQVASIVSWMGYGVPDESRASTNTDHRTTLITSGTTPIKARECHVYQIPIPAELRRVSEDFDIRIDVTLAFLAAPRRTRRRLRRYLSTWVDWRSSKLGEPVDSFRRRVLKEELPELDATDSTGGDEGESSEPDGTTLPWTLHEKEKDGLIKNARRNAGSVQKDWAVVKSNALPEHFCIAVVGHEGWNHDPDATAQYCLAVTIEIQGQEIAIYDPLRVAVEELKAEVGVEAEIEVEVEVEG